MRIAVTGGAGRLGTVLVHQGAEHGHDIVILERPGVSVTVDGALHRQVEVMQGDTRQRDDLIRAFASCDAVVHLAAHTTPHAASDFVVHNDNVTGSFNVLSAAVTLGITRVCIASSINAIGGAFSRDARYDYLPVDESHPTYSEDAYSLSKWIAEAQAACFARRYSGLKISCLRFHGLVPDRQTALRRTASSTGGGARGLWGYTAIASAADACLRALTADYEGHESFYIVAPLTCSSELSSTLYSRHYGGVPLRRHLVGHEGFFDCSKAEMLLGWKHGTL